MSSIVVSVVAPIVRRPPWIQINQRSFLGIQHKRTPAPYIVTGSTLIRYRTTTPNVNTVLRLLNNNRNTENTYEPTADWKIATGHFEGVMFVDCVEQGVGVVEIELGGFFDPLPVFIFNESDEQSFKLQLGDAKYAWLDLDTVSILVPPASMMELHNVSLRNLQLYYKEIISFYDSFIGLIDDPTMASANSNTNKQFFIKADINGPGTAYYGQFWTANSTTHLGPYLQPSTTNWLVLHEIGHAYDFGFVQYSSSLIEVWNNILCDRLQYHWMNTAERQNISRIYEGKRAEVEIRQAALIDNNTNLDAWGYFEKLVFFVWIMNHDSSVFTEINRSYRIRSITRVRQPHHWIWLASLSDYDLLPLLLLCNATPALYMRINTTNGTNNIIPPDSIAVHHLVLLQIITRRKCLYPINFLISNFNMTNFNYDVKQYLETNFTLFTPLTLKQTHIRVSFTITFHIHDMSEIEGDTITIYDGLDQVCSAVVSKLGIANVNLISPGVYKAQHPRGRQNFYTVCYDNFTHHEPYLIVRSDTTNIDLQYTKRVISEYDDEEGFIMGYDQIIMGALYVNGPARRVDLYLNNVHCSPNQGSAHYHILKFYHNDNSVTELIMTGNSSSLGNGWHTINNVKRLEINSRISCFIFLEVMLPPQSVIFALTNEGVFLDNNVSLVIPDSETRLRSRVNRHCMWLDNHPVSLSTENDVRDNIYLATHHKETARYDRYYPDRVRQVGVNYEFLFNGYDNTLYFRLSVRLLENIGTLVVTSSDTGPNINYDDIYIKIKVQNSKSDDILFVECRGNESILAQHHDFPLCENYTLQLFHREPTKLVALKNFETLPNFNQNKQTVNLRVEAGLLVIIE